VRRCVVLLEFQAILGLTTQWKLLSTQLSRYKRK
jgi:hypothetical protein